MKRMALGALAAAAFDPGHAASIGVAETIPLWPEGVPGAKPGPGPQRDQHGSFSNISEPTPTDVLRAVRIVRSQAAHYHVQPDRIGVTGSSAGGHLAASAGTLYDHPLGYQALTRAHVPKWSCCTS